MPRHLRISAVLADNSAIAPRHTGDEVQRDSVKDGSVIITKIGNIGIVVRMLLPGSDYPRCQIFWVDGGLGVAWKLSTDGQIATISHMLYRTLVF